MSQKSSVMQLPQFVPKALTSDNRAEELKSMGNFYSAFNTLVYEGKRLKRICLGKDLVWEQGQGGLDGVRLTSGMILASSPQRLH